MLLKLYKIDICYVVILIIYEYLWLYINCLYDYKLLNIILLQLSHTTLIQSQQIYHYPFIHKINHTSFVSKIYTAYNVKQIYRKIYKIPYQLSLMIPNFIHNYNSKTPYQYQNQKVSLMPTNTKINSTVETTIPYWKPNAKINQRRVERQAYLPIGQLVTQPLTVRRGGISGAMASFR